MMSLPAAVLEIETLIERLKEELHPEDYPEALHELSTRVDAALYEWNGETPDDIEDEDDEDFECEG